MDDKILILYVEPQNMMVEDTYKCLQTLQQVFPNIPCICLSTDCSLEEVEKNEAIKKLQKMIEYLRQE